jgi:omega-6 fatty acid desaturase (delta-12 desaturase)
MSARIPNDNLHRAHDGNPIFHDVPTLSLWGGLRAVRLKLWDERSGRLVTFAQARAIRPEAQLPQAHQNGDAMNDALACCLASPGADSAVAPRASSS